MSIVASIISAPWDFFTTVLYWTFRSLPELAFSVLLGYAVARLRKRLVRRFRWVTARRPSPRKTLAARRRLAEDVGPEMSPDFVLWLAYDSSREVRRILASNPKIEFFPDAIMALAHDPVHSVRHALARNPGIKGNPAAIERLLWDPAGAMLFNVSVNTAVRNDSAGIERIAACAGIDMGRYRHVLPRIEELRDKQTDRDWPKYEQLQCELDEFFNRGRAWTTPFHYFRGEFFLYKVPRGRLLRHIPYWGMVALAELMRPPITVWRALSSNLDLPRAAAEYLAHIPDERVRQNLLDNPATPPYVFEYLLELQMESDEAALMSCSEPF